MKPREFLGCIIAVKGAGLTTVVALVGLNQLVVHLPWALPILWVLGVAGFLTVIVGLGIAASGESSLSD